MKDNQVKEILFDLYMVDENLKEYEQELKDIILELYYSRPDTEFDETFKQNLKEELLLKIQSFKRDHLNRKINLSNDLPKESNLLIFMKKFNYILGGASVSTLAILVGAYFMISSGQITLGNKDNQKPLNEANNLYSASDNKNVDIQINSTPIIKSLSSNAFGKIGDISSDGRGSDNSGYAGISMKDSKTNSAESSISNPAATTDKMMITPYIPEYYIYTYNDSKDKLNYDTNGLEVLKKTYSGSSEFNPGNININNLDLTKFKNLKLNNISLDENSDNGYSIYFNFNDGSLSINKNWQKWPMVDYNRKLKITDIPNDESLIKISNEFLAKYGVNTKNYGSPEVLNEWKQYYEQSTDKDNYYIPTSISVLYPLTINGKQIYESYGSKIGITVNIDITSNKVDSMYGIQSQSYESSKYDLETDISKLLEVIKIGGEMYSPRYTSDTNIKEISSNVKNPTIAYVRTYKYENNNSYELYVPAMILNIENNTNNYYRKNIVIPLTKDAIEEILKNNKQQPVVDPAIDVKPLMKTEKK